MPDNRPDVSSEEPPRAVYGQTRRPAAPPRRKRWIFIVIGVVVAALALWAIFISTAAPPTGGRGHGGGGRHGGGGKGGGMPIAVNAAKATIGDMPIQLYELGTVTPRATVTVRTQISGQLLTVGFTEGQMVRKGQFLAQVDPRPYQAALAQAQGNLARDAALLQNARLDLQRYRTLLSQDSIARQTADTQAALVRQYEGTIKTDQAAIDAQKLNLVYCHIVSPVSGRVGLRQVDAGNYVTPGDSNGLVVVTQLDPIDVLFSVPEDNLPKIAARLRSGATLPVTAFDRTQTTQLAQGHLLTVDNQIDTTTGTVRAKGTFANGAGALFPNQFVNVRLTVDTLHNAVIVPTSAILKGEQGMFVYVVQQNRTAKVTPVKVGPAVGDNTAITSGITAGAVVVTDGSDRLRDGGIVILPGDCLPAHGRYGHGGQTGGGSAQGAAKAKGGGGFFGLFKKKPQEDPRAALRCKPGQVPHSLLSGGTGAAPAVGTTTTTKTTTTSGPAPAAAQAAPPAPAAAQGGGQGSGQGGGGRMAQMLAGLNLDAGQQAKAQAIFAAARQQGEAGGDRRAAFQDAFTKLDAILRPDQKAALAKVRADMAARRAAREAGGGDQ